MEATKKLNGKAVGKWLSNNAIIIMMLAVTLIVGIIHPNFFSGTNMINLFKNVSIRYIIALGISGCLITTGNDLSAGRLAGFAACLACIFAQTEGASGKFYPNMPTLSTPVVFILVIAICAIVGLCNGLVVSYLKVQPFIATLGMQQVVYGICLVYTGGTPIGSLNSNFTALAKDTFLAIPVLIWFALIVAVCFWFLYNKTRHGKYMYAIGGNEAAAEVAGVNVIDFGGGSYGDFNSSKRGGDLRAEISVSFDEAAFGCEKKISLQGQDGKISTVQVKIPAGIESGKTIRLRGKGMPGSNSAGDGDLLLKVTVQEKPGFERKGADLYTTVKIPFTTAVLGGEAEVATLTGKVVCRIKPGTQSGSRIRLKGKGIVSMKDASVHGDQYVTVQIDVPKNLSAAAKQKLREFEEACKGGSSRGAA